MNERYAHMQELSLSLSLSISWDESTTNVKWMCVYHTPNTTTINSKPNVVGLHLDGTHKTIQKKHVYNIIQIHDSLLWD